MAKKNEATRAQYALKPKRNDPSYNRIEGNYAAKKYKKGTPCVTRLSFEFTGAATRYIDIAQALSLVNRKLFRQGHYYYVNSVEVYNAQDFIVDFHTLPDNWCTRAAYRRGKAIWDNMNQKAMENTGQIAGKWHDFKVYMSDRHRTTGSTRPSLYDLNSAHSVMGADDWMYSEMVSADDDQDGTANADQWKLHMIGGHNGSSNNWLSVGLIKSYEDARGQVSVEPVYDKAELLADPLTNLFDYSSEEQINDIIDNLADDSDEPPYDADVMVGVLPTHHNQVGRAVTTSQSGRVTTLPGFCAPLGLIMVDPQNNPSDDSFRVVLNIAVGTYNGVYAERIA